MTRPRNIPSALPASLIMVGYHFYVSPDSDIASRVCMTTIVSVFFHSITYYFLN